MLKIDSVRERLSIDVFPEEHRQIKAYAALHGKTIREYVIESVRERLRIEKEEKELSATVEHLDRDSILKRLWNNKKDASYDKM